MRLVPPFSQGDVAGTKVSRETWERLEDYCQALLKWSRAISLVANDEEHRLWKRHVIDSAQLWPLRHPETRRWADLGSGGGLPGVVLAIIGKELSPGIRFHLVESDGRKAAFLRFIESRQNLGMTLHTDRIEAISSIRAQTVTARALAPLSHLLGFVEHHISPGGFAILPKGRKIDREIEEARKTWQFTLLRHPSRVDSQGSILQITDIHRL